MMLSTRPDRLVLVTLTLVAAGAGLLRARETQIPQSFTNLQVLPRDMPRAAVIQQMREFSFALGVRCEYCHAGDPAALDYAADTKPAKRTARAMLRMVATLNTATLPAIPDRRDPPTRVDCVICHRGLPVPRTLSTELQAVIREQGVPAAIERYRALRAQPLQGLFNFGEWTMNELARELAETNQMDAAIAMLELNAEFYPTSASIDRLLADLFERQGRRDRAIERLEAAITKVTDEPLRAALRTRIEALKRGG